jgi:hypothetical protein
MLCARPLGYGELCSEGRENETQVILSRRLREALEALNPGQPADAYAQAVEQLAREPPNRSPSTPTDLGETPLSGDR